MNPASASQPTVQSPAASNNPGQTRLIASDVMTATELAKMLGVPTSTVHHWAREGTIPSLKIGRRRVFIRQKIEGLLLSDSR